MVACGNEKVFGRDHNVSSAAVNGYGKRKINIGFDEWRVPIQHEDVTSAYVKDDKELKL